MLQSVYVSVTRHATNAARAGRHPKVRLGWNLVWRQQARTCRRADRPGPAPPTSPYVQAYAEAAPITRASGKTLAVLHRRVKNQRLAAAGYVWAFSALTASPGARAHYDRRKTAGDRHALSAAMSPVDGL